jgi:hypothetical protein
MENRVNHSSGGYVADDGEYVCFCCKHWKRLRVNWLVWGWAGGIWSALVIQALLKAFA